MEEKSKRFQATGRRADGHNNQLSRLILSCFSGLGTDTRPCPCTKAVAGGRRGRKSGDADHLNVLQFEIKWDSNQMQ